MNYFSNLDTVDEIKEVYRSLAFEHHPDRGGDHATMQTINRQYHEALKRCDNQRSMGDAGKEHTYRYDEKLEQAAIEAIYKLIALFNDALAELLEENELPHVDYVEFRDDNEA